MSDPQRTGMMLEKFGAQKTPYITIAGTVNMAGGQPISMSNMREVRALLKPHNIKIVFDATRAMENVFFIQQREEGYRDKTLAQILKEMCSYADVATMSAKKDLLVNIGGFLALNDEEIFEEARNMVVVFEGVHTF